VRRFCDDLDAEAPQAQLRQALDQLAALAAGGGSDGRAVEKEATSGLAALLANASVAEADRKDAGLILALVGAEQPLRELLADTAAPVRVRQRGAESLGLLAKRCGDGEQRQRIEAELQRWLRSERLDVLIEEVNEPALVAEARQAAQQEVATHVARARASGQLEGVSDTQLLAMLRDAEEQVAQQQLWANGKAPGWAKHDASLPLLQGAARGLQLAASADLPLAGSGLGRVVPMLTLTALEEEGVLRIHTEVVDVQVWALPLPGDEQLELVAVPAGETTIGSPSEETGRDDYTNIRQKCEGVDVEALRAVSLGNYAMVRHPISQAQWRAVVEGVAPEQRGRLNPNIGTFKEPADLWERFGQPGALPVDSVSMISCQEWLQALNVWIVAQWPIWAQQWPSLRSEPPQLALPSETQWEVACRAGSDTPFHFGASLDPSWARYNAASDSYGKGRRGEYEQRPVPIGFFGLVNRWGLAELHGQLQEWCADQWHRSPVRERQAERRGWFGGGGKRRELLDGSAIEGPDLGLAEVPREMEFRLLRGGSWCIPPPICRSAYRLAYPPFIASADVGFRPGCFSPPGLLLGP